jgi:signal peptidase I
MNQPPPAPPAKPAPTRRRRALRFLLILVVGTVLSVPLVRWSLVDWNDLPTSSMEPSILKGDRIVVNRAAYDLKVPLTSLSLLHRGDPQLGDLVVFLSPHDGRRLVKRVIGLPGDEIELRGGQRLYRNGRPAAYTEAGPETLDLLSPELRAHMLVANEDLEGRSHPMMVLANRPPAPTFGPLGIPAGSYFVMGDNRDNSRDSRYFGTVPRESILGRADWVIFSLDRENGFKLRKNRSYIRLR